MNLDNKYKLDRRIAEDRLEIALSCIDNCITDKRVLKELKNKLRAIK